MFRRILKIVGIVMLSGVGVIGATAGVLAIKGEFSNKKYKPNVLSFENTVMYVDDSMDDLSFKVFADSEKVNVTDITLHILEGEELIEITADETNIDEDITFRMKNLDNNAVYSSTGKVVIEARNSDNTVSTYPNNLTIYVDRRTEAVSIQDTNNTNNNDFWHIVEDDGKVTYYNGTTGATKTITINVGDEYQLTPLFYPAYSNHPISEKSPKIVEYYMKEKEELNGTLYASNGSYYVRGERAGEFVIRVATYASYSIQDALEASRPSNELDVEREYRLNSMVVSEIRFVVKNIDVDSVAMDGTAPEFELGKTTRIVLNNATSDAHNLGIKLYKSGTPVEQKLNEVRFVNDIPYTTPGSYLTFETTNNTNLTKYFDINYVSGSGNNRVFEITPLRYVTNLTLKLTVINENYNRYTKTINNISIDYSYVDAKINRDIIIPIGESGVGNVSLSDYLTVDNASNTYDKVLYFVEAPAGDTIEEQLSKIPYDVIPNVQHNGDFLIGYLDDSGNIVLDQLRCKTGIIDSTRIYAVVVRASLDGTAIYDKNGNIIDISRFIDTSTGTSTINLAYSGTGAVGSVVSSSHVRHKVTPVYTIGDIAIYLEEGTRQDGVIDEPDVIDPDTTEPEPTPDDPVNLTEPEPADPDTTDPDTTKYELRTTAWRLREQYTTGEGRPENGPTLVIRDQGTINALAYALQNAKANNFNYSLSAYAYNGSSLIGTLGSNEIVFGELKPYTEIGEWLDGDIKDIYCYKCTLDIRNYPTLKGYNENTEIKFFLNYSYNNYVSKAEESEKITILSGDVTGISVKDANGDISKITVKADWDPDTSSVSYQMYIGDSTDGIGISDIESDILATYIHFAPDYAINKSYIYEANNDYFEISSKGTEPIIVFKKTGTDTLTIRSTDKNAVYTTITVSVDVPANKINTDNYTGTDTQAMTVYASQCSLATLTDTTIGGVDYQIVSAKLNNNVVSDFSNIVNIDGDILRKDNEYLNDDVTVTIKVSSIFASDIYLYINLSSPVSVKLNSANPTDIVYKGTTFAIAEFSSTVSQDNSPLLITRNDNSVTLTYKLNGTEITTADSTVNGVFLIDTTNLDYGEYTFKIYVAGIWLQSYTFTVVPNVVLTGTNSKDNREIMKPGDSIDINEKISIKSYDTTTPYYKSYGEPTETVGITNITPSTDALTISDTTTITAGWIQTDKCDVDVYFNDNPDLKYYIRIVNDMTASLSITTGTTATDIDMSSALNDSDGWRISNITADDSNVKYIGGKLIYDAFIPEDKAVTLTVTIANDGKYWSFDSTFTFKPLLPTISTDVSVKAGTGHNINEFVSDTLTYHYVDDGEIKSGTQSVNITIGCKNIAQTADFDAVFGTLAKDDVITVGTDQHTFTIGPNVGNGAQITLDVKVAYGDISYTIDDFVIMALPTEELVITYPTITDGAENVQAGKSINMFTIDQRFGSSYQRVIHSFMSTATIAYLDSTYETLGYKDVDQLVHIDGGVVTFDSTFMNMGSGAVTLVITTSTGRSAQYVVNVRAVSDDEYSFAGGEEGHVVICNETLNLTNCLTIKDQYDIDITEYTVVAVDGAECISADVIENNVLTTDAITFQTVYSTHVIKFAIYVNINNNIVFVDNYSITLVPNVTVTAGSLTEVKKPISYEYELTLILDEDTDFSSLITVEYNDVTISIDNISCDDSDERMSISGSTVTFKPVASVTTYPLHLYYTLDTESGEYFVIDVTVTVKPGDYFKSDVKSNVNPDADPIDMSIGSVNTRKTILDLVLTESFRYTEYANTIDIYDKNGNGPIEDNYFASVNKTTYIEYTFVTSFGAKQTFTFVVYPNIYDTMDYTVENKGSSQSNVVDATKVSDRDKTIGSTINLSQYVNIKHKNGDNYALSGIALNITTTDVAYAGYLLGYDSNSCTIRFAHSATAQTFCLNIEVPFGNDGLYFDKVYTLWVTIPVTYGMTAQYLVDGASCEYVTAETSLALTKFYDDIKSTSLAGLTALHSTRLVADGESMTLTEIFAQSGINAIQIETSENIIYNAETEIFTFLAVSDNEYIRFYNSTGLDVRYDIKIKSSVVNGLSQNYNNTATATDTKYEKVVYADDKISGKVLSTTDASAWAMWYTDTDYSGTVKMYWDTNTDTISITNSLTEISIDSWTVSATPFSTHDIHVLTDAGYVGVIHIILVPENLGYEIGYATKSKTNEEIYGNIDGLSIYGQDFVNKVPRVKITGIADTYTYTTTLGVYTVNNQQTDKYAKYITLGENGVFGLKTVSQDTVIVLNVTISVGSNEVLKFRYNILVKNHLVIDMPYATNKTLDVFLNDFTDKEINFAGSNYAQVTLLKYSNDSTADTGYTSEYISSASLVYTASNTAVTIANSVLTVTEEGWVNAVDAKMSLPLRVATPSGEYYQDYTLIIHPSITIVKNTWSDSATYNGYEVHSGINSRKAGSQYEIFGFNADKPRGDTPYKVYTMTSTVSPTSHTYTNYYLSSTGTGEVGKSTATVSVKYQIIDMDGDIDDSKWNDATYAFTDGLLTVTLPYVDTEKDQIVVYQITVDSITFNHRVKVTNDIFSISTREIVVTSEQTLSSFSLTALGSDSNALLIASDCSSYEASIVDVFDNDKSVDDFSSLISISSNTITLKGKFTNELRFFLKITNDGKKVGKFGPFRIIPESTEMTLTEYSLVRDFGYSASELGASDIKIMTVWTSVPTSGYNKVRDITRIGATDTLYSYTHTDNDACKLYQLAKTAYALYTNVNAFIVPQQNDINLDTIYINTSDITSYEGNYYVDLTKFIKVKDWNIYDNKIDDCDDFDKVDIESPLPSGFTLIDTRLNVPSVITEQVSFKMKVTYTSGSIALTKIITVYVNPTESYTSE